MKGIITITTDFGYEDHYAGVLKTEILKINPRAVIVEITHGVRRHSVRHAAYILQSIIGHSPRGTVHLMVVDPGVGTERRGVVAELDAGFFVGPDNGILTLVKDRVKRVYRIEMRGKSVTFHGRDIFAPVAARVEMGDFSGLEEIDDFLTYPIFEARLGDGEVEGEILHVDYFGNVITNIPSDMVSGVRYFEFSGIKIPMKKTYMEGKSDEIIALINSENYLELAVNQGSAQEKLQLREGEIVKMKIR